MTRELISKRTRTAFREFLVDWTLREIEDEFEAESIERDRAFGPGMSGQRRVLVEQYYRTVNFTELVSVRRLLAVYARIIERAKRELPATDGRARAEQAISKLETCLAMDGLAYKSGSIVATTSESRAIFDQVRSISEITRRAIFACLSERSVAWSGQLSEAEFLAPLYDLERLPSHDSRYSSMKEDLYQHRVRNNDWEDDWVYRDDRIDLLATADDRFLTFLCAMVHPRARPDTQEARALVVALNERLRDDGWELIESGAISGRATFVSNRRAGVAVTWPDTFLAKEVLSDEYVRELNDECDSRLARGNFEGAITIARTSLESILYALEFRLAASRTDCKGDLSKQYKLVTQLLRMDDQRPDLDDRFKDVIRGLVMVVSGIASIRNKMSDGHARARKPAPHHARVVVNAVRTVSAFLVESYAFQVDKGLVPRTAAPAAKQVPK